MNKVISGILALSIVALVSACTSSSDPESGGAVRMNTQLQNNVVSGVESPKSGDVQGPTLTVEIESTRILVSRMKFHKSDDEENEDGSNNVKTGPAVLDFTEGETQVFLDATVPAGTYRKVKLEKHKFSASEAEMYADDPVFGEFAVPTRITLIIDGFVNVNGVESAFTITDPQVENLWIDFNDGLIVEDGGSAQLQIVFDASEAFKDDDGNVLNPQDAMDLRDIMKNLKHAFRIQNGV